MTTADADRYGVLHDAAEGLLDDLEHRYIVERREAKETFRADGPLVRTVWLVPHTPAAAPLGVMFTDVPGVVLRLGRWYQQSLPACGCPACDEDPATLRKELRTRAAALVEGGLWERVRRRVSGSWSQARLIGPDFTTAQQAPLDPGEAREARRAGFAAPVQWAPWPERPTG